MSTAKREWSGMRAQTAVCIKTASTAFVDTTTTATLVASPQTPDSPEKQACVHSVAHSENERREMLNDEEEQRSASETERAGARRP